MSNPDPAEREPRSASPSGNGGVLANLPRTRPQRSSPRRAAARKAAEGRTGSQGAKAAPKSGAGARLGANKASPKPRGQAARKPSSERSKSAARPRGESEPVPSQGYESQGENVSGSVQPPGGFELVASAVEIMGELAKAGARNGERVLKDVFSRLPRP